MTASFHIQLHEDNEVSKLRKTTLASESLEVSQGPQRTVMVQKGNPTLATVGIFNYLVTCLIALPKPSTLGEL